LRGERPEKTRGGRGGNKEDPPARNPGENGTPSGNDFGERKKTDKLIGGPEVTGGRNGFLPGGILLAGKEGPFETVEKDNQGGCSFRALEEEKGDKRKARRPGSEMGSFYVWERSKNLRVN